MVDDAIGDLFVCEDYTLETFQFNDISQKLYCLKSSVTDFDLTGQIIWPAAIALSKYIVDNKELFTGKNIIELGAGAGLSGFIGSHFANRVVLSDNNEFVLKLLKKNVDYFHKDNYITSVFVEDIAWGVGCLENLNVSNSFGKQFTKDDKIDILMGADVIFWPESLDGLLETIEEAIRKNPECLVLISFYSRVKYTNTSLEQKMEQRKLKREVIYHEENQYIFKVTKEN